MLKERTPIIYSDLEELPVFVFSCQPTDDDATVYSRMFGPCIGIPEDPATGAASGPLGNSLRTAIGSQDGSYENSLPNHTAGRCQFRIERHAVRIIVIARLEGMH
jgi:predicted PhzF superfamily epimerase YddE/YHI9